MRGFKKNIRIKYLVQHVSKNHVRRKNISTHTFILIRRKMINPTKKSTDSYEEK